MAQLLTSGVGVEKSAPFLVFWALRCARERRGIVLAHLSSSRYRGSGRPAQESYQSFDVLGGGRQEELLSDEVQPAQAQATRTDVTLEFGEQCFDLLPLSLPLASKTPARSSEITMRRRILACGLLIAIALMAWFVHSRFARPTTASAESAVETPFQAFWAPAMRNPKPVLICIGSPVTYNYSEAFRGAYLRRLHLNPDDDRDTVIESPGIQLKGSDLVPVKNEFVGAGDANAASLLSALFGSLGKTTEFRISTETSYSELSDSPTILLGAFSNRWTERTMSRTPYVFVEKDSVRSIEEQTGGRRSWTPPRLGVDGKTDEDYTVVSRILDAETGQFLVTAAGISGFGSRAAGYFLTRPEQMARELDKAPKGWMHKNLQFVLRTHVVDGAPTAPEVVALTCW